MPSLECSGGMQPSSCKTPDGRIWFPTAAGVVAVNPENTKINHQPPPVIIEEIVANGHKLADRPTDKTGTPHPAGLAAL